MEGDAAVAFHSSRYDSQESRLARVEWSLPLWKRGRKGQSKRKLARQAVGGGAAAAAAGPAVGAGRGPD